MSTPTSAEDEAWLKSQQPGEGNGEVPSLRYKKRGGLYSGRTLLEKILVALLAMAVLLLIILVIVLIVNRDNGDESSKSSSSSSSSSSSAAALSSPHIVTYQGEEICLTKDCVNAASRLDQHINYKVSPCDDFYQFACGRWMQENAIADDQASLSTFSTLRDDVGIVLRNLLQEEHKPDDLECMKKAKDLYASCLDTELIRGRGDQVMKDYLETEFGGWPLTHQNWNEAHFDLVNLTVRLNQLDTHPVFYFYAGLDNKDSSNRVLSMDQPSFGMPGQKYYQVSRDDKMLLAYQDLIMGVATLLGLADPSTAERDVREIVDFEIRLANISVPDEERRDSNVLYNPMTLAEIHGNYSQVFDWSRYVKTLLLLPEVGILDISDKEIIINRSPKYFSRLMQVIQDTPKRILANHMVWRAALGVTGTQGEAYAELLRKYNKVLFGTSSERPRFRQCAGYATANVPLAVGRMFIRENFQVEAKTMALEMIDDLQASFNELLDGLDWMDEQTKQVAKEKNNHISPKIGYPEQVMNDTYLEELYSNLTYLRDGYFENALENKRQAFSDNMRRLREPFDKKLWKGNPSTVNAFYSPMKNQIMFPAGILQPPFFSQTYPKSLNYGGIGVVIGHEITHGFDDKGRQYDKFGNLAQWWNEEAVRKFKEKAQCVIDQYGNFTVAEIGMNLNGVNTQGENIADNGGLKQAFKAYRNWVARQGREEPLLPGIGFTHNQLFFINFAQLWCIIMRDASALQRIRTGMHSPGRFRVVGSAQNLPEFAEAFNCPKDSYMNPKKKCGVW